jgi:hypothetical protein
LRPPCSRWAIHSRLTFGDDLKLAVEFKVSDDLTGRVTFGVAFAEPAGATGETTFEVRR